MICCFLGQNFYRPYRVCGDGLDLWQFAATFKCHNYGSLRLAQVANRRNYNSIDVAGVTLAAAVAAAAGLCNKSCGTQTGAIARQLHQLRARLWHTTPRGTQKNKQITAKDEEVLAKN